MITFTEAMDEITKVVNKRNAGGYGTDSDFVDDVKVWLELLK